MKDIITVILITASIAGFVWCFSFFLKQDLTTNEQVLFSIFLSLSSFFTSWLITHYYQQVSHKASIEEIKKESTQNLKTYATKAAEKVRNLSVQLTGLTTYLNEELINDDYECSEENLFAKTERLKSAIHIIKTLKTINDGSLSDWSGVIPEEIEEIEEDEREDIGELYKLVEDFNEVNRGTGQLNLLEDEDYRDVRIEALGKKIDSLYSSLAGINSGPTAPKIKREKILQHCPSCKGPIEYRQKPKKSSMKKIQCKNCNVKITSRWNEIDGFYLQTQVEYDEDFLKKVEQELPEQPWLKGVDKEVAKTLSVSNARIKKAINELIRRGIFKHQVNGEVINED